MSNYDFDVLVHGKSTLKYIHEGRAYIEGRAGSEFTIFVRNNTATRVLAVLTVDGLSVMDGKSGSMNGSGYIVMPFSSIKVPGWRLSNDDVAKFTFGGKKESYAAQKGDARNVGVIGCAIFEEYLSAAVTFTNYNPDWFTERSGDDILYGSTYYNSTTSRNDGTSCTYSTCDSLHSGEVKTSGGVMPSSSRTTARKSKSAVLRSTSVQNIGTEFGKRAAHTVTEVDFVRKTGGPAETFVLHYDDRAGLKARGIDVDRKIMIANPFPKDAEGGCVPPAGWRG